MFHIPPVMEEPWLCSGARRLSPVGIFIFQCTIKALPSYSDSFQGSVDMKSCVRASERVIKASVSAEEYYRCILSCRLSSCPGINLARCNTEAAFSRSLRTTTATLCYPTPGEWAPFGKTNKWSESKLKVAVSFIFFFLQNSPTFLDWSADIFNSGAHMLVEATVARCLESHSVSHMQIVIKSASVRHNSLVMGDQIVEVYIYPTQDCTLLRLPVPPALPPSFRVQHPCKLRLNPSHRLPSSSLARCCQEVAAMETTMPPDRCSQWQWDTSSFMWRWIFYHPPTATATATAQTPNPAPNPYAL